MTAWNVDRTETVDGGIRIVTAQGLEIIVRMEADPDGTPIVSLEPQAGVSLEGDTPGTYYVMPMTHRESRA